ncbi:unnamed protein product [Mytilus coruscus]|uniref:Uncharacterized protein n=1 Tax=Mytilus coruscus TaxID=42192 RepID=A0A6J8ETQ8_MYTCO|nr:unnamed protein product [Mytilus coruscus]
MQDSIGNEERWARECFEELKEDGLEVNEVTTDPDSSAYRAAEYAIVGCYCGDHTDCSLYSFVCSISRKSQSWIDKSAYLKRHNFEIELNENSENILRQCVNYRLGPGMLAKTAKSANSQKVEALNRSIRSTVPVNVTYARNFTGRVHTACHKVNHGTGNSIVILCEAAGSPIQPGTKVAKSLKN